MGLTKNLVFKLSAILLIVFSILVFLETEAMYNGIEAISLWVRDWFGQFYLYLGAFCVLFIIAIAVSPLGKIKLGGRLAKPEYSFWVWLAMLYSTGMGAGILLRAVQEPAYMFTNPPLDLDIPDTILALEFTFYQWGLTAWAFYGLFAIIIGFYIYNKKQNLLPSAPIRDITKSKSISYSIDILAILTTVFGLIAAIALGATQITGGLSHLKGREYGLTLTIIVLSIISILAFISVYRGINKGIKQLSKLNLIVTLGILIFVITQSDITLLATTFFTATYNYIVDFIPLSLAIGDFNPGKAFLTDWTYYYWAFWISWAPFTGIFIARISKGRSLLELLTGVLLVPSLGTFIWFTAFGNETFEIINNCGTYNNEFNSVFSSIFLFFEQQPLSMAINSIVVILLVSFLVTSLDSAIFVLSIFTSKGSLNPSKKQRLTWAVTLFIFCIAILLLGNVKPEIDVLVALQKLLIITSLPFSILLVIMSVLFFRQLLKAPKD